MALVTGVGEIKLKVWYGRDPESGGWGCPMRQRWGLRPRQRMSPLLEDRLAFTVTATGSYREAAAVGQKCESVIETPCGSRTHTRGNRRQATGSAS